jgi:hypothetical protein
VLQINVNGLTHRARSAPENWGELLDGLENGEGLARQIVTAVRFAGVAVPTFREPGALEQELGRIGVVDVETCTLDELLLTSARAAYASIAPLSSAVQRIAARLRCGSEMAAIRDLPALTRSLQTLTTVTCGLANARICTPPHRADLDALVQRLCLVVDAVVTRQAVEGWSMVADVLERELAPTLDAWALVARRVWNMA